LFDSLDRSHVEAGNRGQLLLRPLAHFAEQLDESGQFSGRQQAGLLGMFCSVHGWLHRFQQT
jgi:hypothetical protein